MNDLQRIMKYAEAVRIRKLVLKIQIVAENGSSPKDGGVSQ